MYFLILASLAATALATVPTGPDCTIGTPLTVTPEGLVCTDNMEPATCALIFGGTPANMTHREAKCEDAGLKKLATEECPKYCGFCCKTPEYNCLNKPFAQTGLNCTTMANKCNDPSWRTIIAQYCPATCGMCLEGGCVDKATDCASQPTMCFNSIFADFARENCARTCNTCTPSTATTAAPTAGPGPVNPPATTTVKPSNPSTGCVDMDVNCASWARNGKFCNNTFYQSQWDKCRRSCGRC